MSPDLLSAFLTVLAVLGCLALVARLGRTLLRLGVNAAEATATSGLAEVSERRGDVTGFLERRRTGDVLRRARRRTAALALGYLALLVLPPLAGYALPVYAASSLLWLLPGRRVRTLSPPGPPPAK